MTGIEQRLAELEAQVARLSQQVVIREIVLDTVEDRAYEQGRESVLGRPAEPRPPRPRHLRAVGGAQ
jgi:hypothetical protein